MAALLAACPFAQLAAVLTGQRFLGFGETTPVSYAVYLAVAPLLAGLLLARHRNTRFSLYLFLTFQIYRGIRFESIPLIVLAILGLVYMQRESTVRVYPRVDAQRILARWGWGRSHEANGSPIASSGLPKFRHGFLGGLIGGLVFALIMLVNGTLTDLGMMTLPLIGKMVGHPSAWVGFGVHMLNSGVIGALYVLVFARIEKGMVDGLHYGLMYGAIWWFVGPMTLMPLLLGMEVGSQWTLSSVFRTFPSLIGHLLYGAILGMTVGAFRDASLPVQQRAGEARARAL
jgi:hypothetical protein